jgi:hypothetical protein
MESDKDQQLPAQERLPAMRKKLAQPDKLSAKAARKSTAYSAYQSGGLNL